MLPSIAIAAFVAATQAPLVRPAGRVPLPRPAANAVHATTHSNHTAAGTANGNVLTIALDVVESAWKPEGDDNSEVPIYAFAERPFCEFCDPWFPSPVVPKF